MGIGAAAFNFQMAEQQTLEVGLYTVQLLQCPRLFHGGGQCLCLLLQGGVVGSEGGNMLAHHAQQGVHAQAPLRLVLCGEGQAVAVVVEPLL